MAERWGVRGFSCLALAMASCAVPSWRGGIGTQCDKNSDCAAPLVCRIGYCRVACATSEDCTFPAQCVYDESRFSVCQTPNEESCALDSDCAAPLVCRFNQCVNGCATEVDCPSGERCREWGGALACIDDVRDRCGSDRECPADLVCGNDGSCRAPCITDLDCRDNNFCRAEPGRECTERESHCVDPDGDGLGSCLFPCPCEDAQLACAGGAVLACVPTCDAVEDCGGRGWTCAAAGGGERVCTPDVPDPYQQRDGGVPEDGSMDAGRDAGVDAGVDGGGVDGGLDGGGRGCGTAPFVGFRGLAAGDEHTCVIQAPESGAPRVFCWGDVSRGQLGRPPAPGETSAPCPTEIPELTGLPVEELAAGGAHTCARLTTGEVWCWGDNGFGQLGRAPVTGDYAPMPVVGLVARSGAGPSFTLAAGGRHTCAASAAPDGLVCWGDNMLGQVDAAGGPFEPMPIVATGSPFNATLVGLGEGHSCASGPTLGSSTILCWGDDTHSQLGRPGVRLLGSFVTAGAAHTCSLTWVLGGAYCWGRNDRGQLGDGTRVTRRVETMVLGLGALRPRAVWAHADHTCALMDDTTLHCWGSNDAGESVPGGPTVVDRPTMVLPFSGLAALGRRHTCAVIGGSGALQCWGDNSRGALGDGTTTPRTGFVTVRSPE